MKKRYCHVATCDKEADPTQTFGGMGKEYYLCTDHGKEFWGIQDC